MAGREFHSFTVHGTKKEGRPGMFAANKKPISAEHNKGILSAPISDVTLAGGRAQYMKFILLTKNQIMIPEKVAVNTMNTIIGQAFRIVVAIARVLVVLSFPSYTRSTTLGTCTNGMNGWSRNDSVPGGACIGKVKS